MKLLHMVVVVSTACHMPCMRNLSPEGSYHMMSHMIIMIA